MVSQIDGYCSTGIYLGRRMALSNLTNGGLTLRFAKGLSVVFIIFEYGESLPAETEVMTLFLSTKARFETAVGYAHQLVRWQRQWPGIFEYRCARVPRRSRQRVCVADEMLQQYALWAVSGSDEVAANQSLQTDR